MPRDDKIQAAYAALGRFLQEFGHACWALQLLILSILRRGGLQDEQMAWIIMADRAMTANVLIDIAQHLIGHLHGGKAEPIFASIQDRFRMLTNHRNDLMHGITFVGWGDEQTTDWSQFEGFKITSSKWGAGTRDLPQSAEDYQLWVAEAQEITVLVHRYWGCLLRGFKLEDNFVHRDGHWRPAEAEGWPL